MDCTALSPKRPRRAARPPAGAALNATARRLRSGRRHRRSAACRFAILGGPMARPSQSAVMRRPLRRRAASDARMSAVVARSHSTEVLAMHAAAPRLPPPPHRPRRLLSAAPAAVGSGGAAAATAGLPSRSHHQNFPGVAASRRKRQRSRRWCGSRLWLVLGGFATAAHTAPWTFGGHHPVARRRSSAPISRLSRTGFKLAPGSKTGCRRNCGINLALTLFAMSPMIDHWHGNAPVVSEVSGGRAARAPAKSAAVKSQNPRRNGMRVLRPLSKEAAS